MRLFTGLLDHARRHYRPGDMPGWVRRRLYRQLIALTKDEQRVGDLLGLPFEPRLCVVDEARVVLLRPSDRARVDVDGEMRQAREQARRERVEEDRAG